MLEEGKLEFQRGAPNPALRSCDELRFGGFPMVPTGAITVKIALKWEISRWTKMLTLKLWVCVHMRARQLSAGVISPSGTFVRESSCSNEGYTDEGGWVGAGKSVPRRITRCVRTCGVTEPGEGCGRPRDQPGLDRQALGVILTLGVYLRGHGAMGGLKQAACEAGTPSASASKANPLPIPFCPAPLSPASDRHC